MFHPPRLRLDQLVEIVCYKASGSNDARDVVELHPFYPFHFGVGVDSQRDVIRDHGNLIYWV